MRGAMLAIPLLMTVATSAPAKAADCAGLKGVSCDDYMTALMVNRAQRGCPTILRVKPAMQRRYDRMVEASRAAVKASGKSDDAFSSSEVFPVEECRNMARDIPRTELGRFLETRPEARKEVRGVR